ncbi:MAG TPA: hypothetical protein VFP34_10070 [Microlunatus sp.]|nr:hypothetical protein [Microlunatus sp.]
MPFAVVSAVLTAPTALCVRFDDVAVGAADVADPVGEGEGTPVEALVVGVLTGAEFAVLAGADVAVVDGVPVEQAANVSPAAIRAMALRIALPL